MVSAIGAKPVLPSAVEPTGFPAGSVLDALVETINGVKKDCSKVLRVTVNEPLKYRRDQMDLLGKEQCKALEDMQWVNKGLSIVSYGSLLYATATILGGYYLRRHKEEASGDQFIKSGLILLSNTLMTYLDGWKQIARILSLGNRTVEQVLESALPLVTIIFTQAWNGRNLSNLSMGDKKKIEEIEKWFKYFQMPLLVADFALKVMKGHGERQLQYIESEMFSKTLDVNQLLLRRGRIQDTFDNIGSSMRRVVKNIFNITSTVDYPSLSVTVHFRGDLRSPQLIFESNPSMPTSSILARILFNKDVSELSAGQALQLANTIVTLSGNSGPNVLDSIRKSIGIDRLSFSANEETGVVAVQIGKYITRGVMISLTQSTESSQVKVEVELKAGFVLEAETQEDNQGKFSFKWNKNY